MAIEIIAYKSKYAQHFYDLNIEWLKTYFYVEPYDEAVLSQPDQYIIAKGGYIFFAIKANKVVGTVALMPTETTGILELTKIAVLPKERGPSIGQQLLQYCIDFGKKQQLELENDTPYNRADIKMVLKF